MSDRATRLLASWAATDRQAFERIVDARDWDEDGVLTKHQLRAANWSRDTRLNCIEGYAYWCRWLDARGELDVAVSPAARVTKSRLLAYLIGLRRLSSVSRETYIWRLIAVLRVIDPKADLSLLGMVHRRLLRNAEPSREHRHLLVPPSDMFYAGLERMDKEAVAAEHDEAAALRYQDSLMMACIACKALRRRNFSMMLIGLNITWNLLDAYEVRFSARETKARKRIQANLSKLLTPHLDCWLQKIRPSLLNGRVSQAMWLRTGGNDISPQMFYHRFCAATKRDLGVRVHPHLARKIVATGVAIAAPELVGMVSSLLDQSSDQMEAYNLADQLSASEAYLVILEERRREALATLPKMPARRRGNL